MFVINSRSYLRSSALALCAVLLSAEGLLSSGHSWAQDVEYRDRENAPPSWTQFAKLVQYRFETWIDADDPIANRFRAYLKEHAGKEDGPPSALTVRAWINPDGTVKRVAFDALKDERADADLRSILSRGDIGEAPPPEMLQPLNLRFSLNVKKPSKSPKHP